ncbi:hypothetical protein [Salinigranum halophilum]|uniref:hypothetical protein n=1 Tax=Salinigranum halophilum TaxID=2565931 RepID=UPI00115CCDA4|nr:hypothetical protein [Salinigranum halophilum]
MGRTNPTYRDSIRGLEDQWQPYRRALRRDDQPHFDRLFEHARAHAAAGGYLNPQLEELPLLVSILLEHERRLCELEQRLGEGESSGEPPNGA